MIRAFQWDLARQTERLDWLLAQLPKYSEWGYEELYLHLEDAVDYPSLPGIARADAYSWRELNQLVDAASACAIKVVPIANLLGHTQYLIKSPKWRDLNELRQSDGSPETRGQICPSHPRVDELIDRLFADLIPLCTAGKIHVGLDESFLLGRSPLSRPHVERLGLAGYFAEYVHRLQQQATANDRQLAIWADMLVLLPEAIAQLPPGIAAYDWYYHGFNRLPRFELHNFATYDLSGPLRKRGIEYWACPMNGAFRHEPVPLFGDRLANAISWWNRAHRTEATGFLVTSWEANHLCPEVTTMIDAAIAGLWLDDDSPDHATMLQRGMQRLGLSPAQSATETRVCLGADDRPFAGYARAERNQFWDTPPLDEGSKSAQQEAQFFQRANTVTRWDPLRLSWRWRSYLAERELFVRRGAAGVLRARRLLSRQKNARCRDAVEQLENLTADFTQLLAGAREDAAALWAQTRHPGETSANEKIVQADEIKLQAWRAWLAAVRDDPTRIGSASPIVGEWQLRLTVHSVRPNANMVVIQQQHPPDEWCDLRHRHTIEFRSRAARRQSRLKRAWSVPLADPHLPLRIALRGLGEVEISRVFLTNGVETLCNQSWPRGQRWHLGHEAPPRGWVDLNWTQNQDAVALDFGPSPD